MPKTFRRLTWVRAGDHYPDLKDEPDHFIALDDGVEVGVVKLVTTGGPEEGRFLWSMLLTHPGPAFKRPTNGTCLTRGAAARELLECWRAFRERVRDRVSREREVTALLGIRSCVPTARLYEPLRALLTLTAGLTLGAHAAR